MKWPDAPGRNVCFDKPLKRETPLWPIPMVPVFRDGKMTPWGGSRLKEIFGKETKDDRTGESMEVSCIPGFESTDAQGRKLTELIAEHREKLVGSYADKPFPLLLKLIDVREKLSVQVHPNDAYAAEHENGKLGKTEAWLVLDTPAGGGDLVYGVKQGTTRDDLKAACDEGTVEKLLNKVKVKRGDVCFIPAGCVHAVGAGVMLYEIHPVADPKTINTTLTSVWPTDEIIIAARASDRYAPMIMAWENSLEMGSIELTAGDDIMATGRIEVLQYASADICPAFASRVGIISDIT
jgi:hypothetical protein